MTIKIIDHELTEEEIYLLKNTKIEDILQCIEEYKILPKPKRKGWNKGIKTRTRI